MLERDEICLEKDSVESNMKARFLAETGNYGFGGREGERGVYYFRGRPMRRNSVLEGLRVR